MAYLGKFLSDFQSVLDPVPLLDLCSLKSYWLVLFQQFLYDIFSGHWVPKMFLRHKFISLAAWSCCFSSYRSTNLTVVIFELVLSARLLQTGRCIWKVRCPFLSLAPLSSYMPYVVLTSLYLDWWNFTFLRCLRCIGLQFVIFIMFPHVLFRKFWRRAIF